MVKNIFHFTLNILKDIFGLILYLFWLCFSIAAPIYIGFFFLLGPGLNYLDMLLEFIGNALSAINENLIVVVGVINLIVLALLALLVVLIFYYTLWLPMFVTNYALDKKWNRILNTFFEKIQYSTIFLILLITLQFVIENTDWLNIAQYIESEFWLKVIKDIKSYLIPYIIFYTFIYLSTIARKFAKKPIG